jgi:hypothetical protein
MTLRSIDGTYCELCGGRMFVDAHGTPHHGSPNDIWHDDDADHTPVEEKEREDR